MSMFKPGDTVTSYDSVDNADDTHQLYINSHADAVTRILDAKAVSTSRPAQALVSFPASTSCSAALAALNEAKILGAPVYDMGPTSQDTAREVRCFVCKHQFDRRTFAPKVTRICLLSVCAPACRRLQQPSTPDRICGCARYMSACIGEGLGTPRVEIVEHGCPAVQAR